MTDSSDALPPRRPEDLKMMEAGLKEPWRLPALALEYSKLYSDGIRPVPYDLLPQEMSSRELMGWWARTHDGLQATLNRPITKAVQERPAPNYSSPLKGRIAELLGGEADDRRSVVFIHHAYYHFYYLARALRERGWRAYSVSIENPRSPNNAFYHGEDLLLWDDDPWVRRELQRELFEAVKTNFDMVHFHGDNAMTLFEKGLCNNNMRNGVPWDFLELKSHGVKIGQSISGCLTGQRQSVFNAGTGGVCNHCVWQNNPSVCSDEKNGFVNDKYKLMLDLNALEIDWPLDTSRQTPNTFYDPLTYCLDMNVWRPDLEIPDRIERLPREPGEILVFHAVGNYSERDSRKEQRNIKGTPAVVEAIDRLRSEGLPVKLVFKTGVPSKDMRFYQIQADIIVDQLIYGRWGATARETMALGLPTICHIERKQPDGVPPSKALADCPLVEATPDTVYDAIKMLATDAEKRRTIGEASRAFAEKWFGAEACAERFETVYDRLQAGKFPLYRPAKA
ncbi:hypothetical protein [Hyphobacterium marinum]|uniref:Glycosyl transferase family 1 domain-containing protein n=1 Tax=Hyphobacterium marinum TaxID=3116574 RepID=A0ABU7LZP2_9PROT|nr:hypothetical protein [Hyphobacterium sp. Y6023]MEE2566475.1 hypothetical protein [Hyphobacterium sp. Y6023]